VPQGLSFARSDGLFSFFNPPSATPLLTGPHRATISAIPSPHPPRALFRKKQNERAAPIKKKPSSAKKQKRTSSHQQVSSISQKQKGRASSLALFFPIRSNYWKNFRPFEKMSQVIFCFLLKNLKTYNLKTHL